MIGMGAIIMDDAVVGANSVIAAGAVVLPGTQIEAGRIYAGVPAVRIKDISDEFLNCGCTERLAVFGRP